MCAPWRRAVKQSPIVQSVGQTFVQQVRDDAPSTPAALQARFATFAAGLDGSLQQPLADFVSARLSADPERAWMADVLTGPSPASASPADETTARSVLAQIKDGNDQLHDKAVRKGRLVSFSRGDENVPLNEVIDALKAGDTLNVQVINFEKASGWAVAGAMMLGGSWPVVDGVNMSSVSMKKTGTVSSLSGLPAAYADAKLAS